MLIYVIFVKSTIPKYTFKMLLAHALPALTAMLCVAAAHLRFKLSGSTTNACSTTQLLTRRCIGPLRVR